MRCALDLASTLPDGPGWAELFRPVMPVLRGAIPRLNATEIPRFEAGPPEGPWARLSGDSVLLRGDLTEAGMRTPTDQAWAEAAPDGLEGLALDRWRRAAGAVLEGVALWRDRDLDLAWAEARAVEAADSAEPGLGLLWPELLDLRLRPELGLAARPRQGAWLLRWLRRQGRTVDQLQDVDLAHFFAWLRDPEAGPSGDSPLPLPQSEARSRSDWEHAPWSATVLRIEAGAAGTRAVAEGGALSEELSLAAGEVRDSVFASRTGGAAALRTPALGPVGTWTLSTGVVQERVGAARGVELSLREDGRLEIVMADAFMGLPTTPMLELAETVGVSGWASGKWRVIEVNPQVPGEGLLRLDRVSSRGLTVHPRPGRSNPVPASALLEPAERMLAALVGAQLRWRWSGENLSLTGPIAGIGVELRFRREGG